VTKRLEKITQSFENVAKTTALQKCQNIYIEAQLNIKPFKKSLNTFNKPYIEIAYFGENVKKLVEKMAKLAQFFGLFYLFKTPQLCFKSSPTGKKNHPFSLP